MIAPMKRRRFIAISAASLASLSGAAYGAAIPAHRWRGVAFGADAEILLRAEDSERARDLIAASLAEVRRLERIFSLYQADSAVSQLNAEGRLMDPPLELVEVLSRAIEISEMTDGAFDVTVQPLWRLYADHFSVVGADARGPAETAIRSVMRLVDYRYLQVGMNEIALTRPSMAVTLNGIAQGYITDCIAGLLRRAGMSNVLVNMGEIRALGRHSIARPWRIGLDRDDTSANAPKKIDLKDGAVATSAGTGFVFDAAGRHHHLFDPVTGKSAKRWRQVSVVANNATTADAFSTAFSALGAASIKRVTQENDIEVQILDHSGSPLRLTKV